ncbi:MAG: sigma-70 family RNA polymerase sigma factor [Candidatus Latescibacteria bacterium]|nr:sigma-70 family RNA polymerase sigma factor [Candidatus Latescibacterota bacterium]
MMRIHAEISDGDLAQAAASGDIAAFEILIGRYQQLLYRDALGYLGSHDEALDAVQEALIGSLQRFGQLRQAVKVGPWLRTAVRRRSLNMLRARQRRTQAHARYGDSLADRVLARDNGTDPVAGLLKGLPAPSATAFLLHYVDGLPLTEVARDLDATPASIKQRLYRARRHLQQEALTMARQQGSDLPDDFAAHVVAHLLKSGRHDRLHMRYPEARGHFREILDLEPQHPTALLEWGRTYDPFNWPDQDQVAALQRAAQTAPDSLEVLSELEVAYRQPGYVEDLAQLQGRLLDLADHRLAADKTDVEALYCKARLLRGKQDFAAALPLLQAATQQAPDHFAARYEYALCLSRLQRHDEAVPVYQSVLEDNPPPFWAFSAHRQLATHLAFRAGDIETAVQHMEAAWQINQTPGEAGNLIYFYSGAGQLDKALELYEKNRDFDYQPRVWATLGMGYVRAGQPEKAETAFAQALEQSQDGDVAAEVHIHLAHIAHRADQVDQCEAYLRQGLALNPGQRQQLAGPVGSPFWLQWTQSLTQALRTLAQDQPQVQDLLEAVESISAEE